MKKHVLALLGLGLLASVSAQAEFYASAGLGLAKSNGSVNTHDLKSSDVYNVAFGWQTPFWDVLRVEGEYLHNRVSAKSTGKVTMDALMGNAYVSVPVMVPFITPYLGAGMGISNLQSDRVFMYQGMLGLDADIFSVTGLIASAEYRYTKANRSVNDDHLKYKYDNHALMLKLRYEF